MTYKTKDNRNVCGGSQVYIEEKKRRNELYIETKIASS